MGNIPSFGCIGRMGGLGLKSLAGIACRDSLLLSLDMNWFGVARQRRDEAERL